MLRKLFVILQDFFMMYRYKNVGFFFGDAATSFIPSAYKQSTSLETQQPFSSIMQSMKVQKLLFLHQVHGSQGKLINCIDQAAHSIPFEIDGDFLVTHLAHIGLAVVTADCLPIIVYDTKQQVIAMIHAGWRGSVQQISVQALHMLTQQYATDPEDVVVFFGPCARVCCYQIGADIVPLLQTFPFASTCIHSNGTQFFFDIVLYNKLQLSMAGIPGDSFFCAYNRCTIDTNQYCSFRKTKSAYRQMSIVVLKK